MRKPEILMTYRVQLTQYSPQGMRTLESYQEALSQTKAIQQARIFHGVTKDFGNPIVTIFHTGTNSSDNLPFLPNS